MDHLPGINDQPVPAVDSRYASMSTWDGAQFQCLRVAVDADGLPVLDEDGTPLVEWDPDATATAMDAWTIDHPYPG